MSGWLLAIMVGVSILMGFFAILALLWGVKTKQFEDYNKFLDGTKFDSEEALQDAIKLEKRKKDILAQKKGYAPPD